MTRSRALVALVAAASAVLPAVAAADTAPKKNWVYPAEAESSGFTPTGQKPESKVWVADGAWWGLLVPPNGGGYRFYRLNSTSNVWEDQGLGGDDRIYTKADVLFHQPSNKLYVASRDNSTTKVNRLYRYSFANGSFKLDSGFPVKIPGGGKETLTIARDSQNRLWVGFESKNAVKLAYSTDDGKVWSSAFTPNVPGASNLNSDDIAAVVSFGNSIGVMWSNQTDQKDYFAVHPDSSAPTSGWKGEVAYSGQAAADDHINLKATSNGTVFAAVKTSKKNSGDPLIVLLRRGPDGKWSAHTAFATDSKGTRPIALVDEATNRIHVAATLSDGHVRYKTSTNLGQPSFPSGTGTSLLSASGGEINDATSAKSTSAPPSPGIVVLATQDASNSYYHAAIE